MSERIKQVLLYFTVRKKKKELKKIKQLVKFMEIIKVNRNNLASVIMGKTIQHPWRGQPDVVISVPFNEWLAFIQSYQNVLVNRSPLSYKSMLASDNEELKIRYFYYDISWSQYSELAMSSNVRKDATLILPYFDNGNSMQLGDMITTVNAMPLEQLRKIDSSLKAATRNYYNAGGLTDMSLGLVDVAQLSEWNKLVYKICMFYQSRSNKAIPTEELNIDWRISEDG